MSSPLKQIVLTLHQQGLDEEEIYLELQQRDLIQSNTAHEIVNIIQNDKFSIPKKSISWGHIFIRIWGVICLLIGIAVLIYIITQLAHGKIPRIISFIFTFLMITIGIKLILNPHEAFHSFN